MKRIPIGAAAWLVAAFITVAPASAQTVIGFCDAQGRNCEGVRTNNPLPVDASVSVGGFTPATTGTPISVTTGGNTGTLPAGAVVAAFNVGTTNTAYCKLGGSATTGDIAIPPASWFAFTVGLATQLTCITSTSTTTVNMVGGSGLPTGAGGGGGGSSGNAAASATGAAVPASADYQGVNVSGTLRGQTGVNPTGSVYAGQVDIASVAGTVAVAPSYGAGNIDSGTQRVVVATDNTIALKGSTANGLTAYGLQSAGSTNATSVKNGAGTVYAMNLINTTTTIYYLRMYNLGSAPTCSSATGFVRSWPIPPASASGGAGGIAVNGGPLGLASFSTGIAFCLTGGPTSTDNTNAATGVFVNLDYL